MLNVALSDALLDAIIRRIIFSAFTGALWLLIVLIIMRLFSVKNPTIRYVFYTLALSKGFVALIREQVLIQSPGKIYVGVQFPSPFALLPNFPDFGESFVRTSSAIAFGPGLMVLAAAAIFLLLRLMGFVRFQSVIGRAPEVDRGANERFFAILDRLIQAARVAYPRVILVNLDSAPFTVGLKQPIIALAPYILEKMNDVEIEAVLAHEIAHIVRRDHLFHWPIVLMRDVLFFNPLNYFVYRRLSFERERACDDFSSKFCRPFMLAKTLLKVAELKIVEPTLSRSRSFAPRSFLSKQESYFSHRVKALIEPRSYALLSGPKQLIFWFGAFIFFFLEVHISLLLGGTWLIFS